MEPRVLVVGAGVTGLAVAHRLLRERPELSVTLLEQRERAGGNIHTLRFDGFVVDGGPDSFLRTKPQAVALCKELGLEGELITPRRESRRVYVAHHGRLVEMPGGMALAVPTQLGPMLATPLLGLGDKLRVLADLVLPAGFQRRSADESIGEFIGRRFGEGASEKLAGPLLGGIYAGDVNRLSINSTFPQLVELERRHGSLVRGLFSAQRARAGMSSPQQSMARRLVELPQLVAWLRRESAAAESPFNSLRGGVGTLIEALVSRLPPGCLRLGEGLVGLEQLPGRRWRARTSLGRELEVDAVVMAQPAHAAAAALSESRIADELRRIPYLSTATVFFAFEQQDVAHDLDGIGFIVPPGEARILAATWVSSKWEARAPAGKVLMRAFLGGARGDVNVVRSSDDDLVAIARRELERLMGHMKQPLFTKVFRYVDSNPQPVIGHADRLARLERLLRDAGGLYLAGAPYYGVGIPDCIRQADDVARRVLGDRVGGAAVASTAHSAS